MLTETATEINRNILVSKCAKGMAIVLGKCRDKILV